MSSPAPQRRTIASAVRLPARLGSTSAALGRARLHLVPRAPQLRSSAPRVPFVTLVSVLLLGGVIGLLLFNTSMQQASFEATSLQGQADTLTAQQQALQAQVDALDDPQRIAVRATRLGMVVAPACTATVNLDRNRVSGSCPAATAEDALPIDPPPVRPPATTVVPTPVDPAPASTGTGKNKDTGNSKSTGNNTGTNKSAGKSTGNKSQTAKNGQNSTANGASPATPGSGADTGPKRR